MTERLHDAAALRARLAADLAAGKTVSLSAADLADPEVRSQLPRLLEELTNAPAAAAPPAPPLRVPGYTLLGEIGHGGMSTVWLARQHALDRTVALKIAPNWLTGDRRTQRRLLQEARAMARLSHPNIVAIHDVLEVDGGVAIAMDWIDGLTLAQILQELPPQPDDGDLDRVQRALGADRQALGSSIVRFFVRVVRDVARAVEHVHRAGLLHLDVKPSNILLRRDGTPLLADFGVVREIDLDLSHTRTFAGTPVYAAPEQLERADAAFGPHTDVYGLGMTLYEMLARAQPLRQLGLTRVLHDVLTGRIPPLASRTPVAADLANVVHKAISPSPRDRYADAGRLADDLTAFLEHRPVAARPLTRPQRLRRWARQEPWKALLAAVLLVTVPALTGLGVYLWTQMPRLERVRLEERRAVASQLKHAAFQAYFARSKPDGEPARLLRAAMARDPGASSLACLLAMAHEEGDAETAQLLAAHGDELGAHLGLRLFAAKVAANRPFFGAHEVEQLHASADRVDKYVLALDRLFAAEDDPVEETWAQADSCLEQAMLAGEPDPLLYGLRAWSSRRLGATGRFAHVERAIRTLWPHDLHVTAWLFYATEVDDPDGAVRLAEALRDRAPDEPHCWEMLVGAADRKGDHERALRHLGEAAAAGVTSSLLDVFRLQALVHRDGKPAAERALREMSPEMLTDRRRLALLRVADPQAALAEQRRLLAGESCPASLLVSIHRDAVRDVNASRREKRAVDAARLADVDRAWQQLRRLHPHRRVLHWAHLGETVMRREPGAARELLAEMTVPRGAAPSQWRSICSMLITAQDWKLLSACARRWQSFAATAQRPEASFYAALADVRTGEPTGETWQMLALATSPAEETSLWWAHAQLESAWQRVRPEAASGRSEPLVARREVAAWERFPERERRLPDAPWNLLVRAEVAFANGDRERAIELASLASRAGRIEPHAPPDTRTMIEAARARYRR